MILPVALNGRETWSLILREEHRLRIFENRVLRRIGRKARGKETMRNQDTGGWIILRWMLERQVGLVWTGLAWLRMGTSCELL
jgi:hypothetical protein